MAGEAASRYPVRHFGKPRAGFSGGAHYRGTHYRRQNGRMTKANGGDVHDMNSGFPGAKSPARTVAVLQHIARHHVQGLSIRELSNLSGLDRSTARRLLMVLVQTGFAAKDEHSGRYRLGVEAMLTGMAAMAKAPVFEPAIPRW